MQARTVSSPVEIQATIQDYFSDRPDIAAVYLFGSIMSNKFTDESDIDIGVLYQANSVVKWELANQDRLALSERLRSEVDLVTLNEASPILCYQVLKTGKCILNLQPSLVNQFFVRTLNEYFDLKAVRRPIEQHLKQVRII